MSINAPRKRYDTAEIRRRQEAEGIAFRVMDETDLVKFPNLNLKESDKDSKWGLVSISNTTVVLRRSR